MHQSFRCGSLEFLGASKRLYKRLSVGWSIGWLVGPSPYCFAPGDLAPGFLLLFVKYDSYDIYESRNTLFLNCSLGDTNYYNAFVYYFSYIWISVNSDPNVTEIANKTTIPPRL